MLCEIPSNPFAQTFTKYNQKERITSSFDTYVLADLEFKLGSVRDAMMLFNLSIGNGYDGTRLT